MGTETMERTLTTYSLREAGQSPWLDQLSRELLRTGKLKSFIEDSGLLGMTSNPSIFEKAITQKGGGYDDDIKRLAKKGRSTFEIYDALTISDIQAACDLFGPLFRESEGDHGFVSLEVAPMLAYETEATIRDALRLFKEVRRPNVMIKVPATPEGIPAVRALVGKGINVNITLMFSLKHYRDVANAYIGGLKDFERQGGDLRRVFSVASIFVSRIDTYIDKKIETSAPHLKGKAAIASSKLIYQEFKKIFLSDSFAALKSGGAHFQKVLWGSTSTKNPAYPDLIYVEPLVGRHTVNTLPPQTFEALLDHGQIRPDSVEEDLEEAESTLQKLKGFGIDLIEAGEVLQRQGVKLFADSFESLMRTLELAKESCLAKKKIQFAKAKYFFGSKELKRNFEREIKNWQSQNLVRRLFEKDATLWKSESAVQQAIKNRLGWLEAPEWMLGRLAELDILTKQARDEKIKDIVLLGMGGSGLAPEVFSLVFADRPGFPRFHVLDTTDADAVRKIENSMTLESSWFIVASKSGSTLETMSQRQYFYAKLAGLYRNQPDKVGRHFVAITDEGSSLETLGREKKFRKVFINRSDIGGRYSALSLFGLVPAALMGIDVRAVLASAREFLKISQNTALEQNPGIHLGILLGVLAEQGTDKWGILTSRALSSFGAWLEQLLAESTGKEGKGIFPIDQESPIPPKAFTTQRAYVILSLKGDSSAHLVQAAKALKKAGYPVVELEWPNAAAMGGEFLRWEIATAVAGAVMKINPFDEPNVKESKDLTAALLKDFEKKGRLETPKNLFSAAKFPYKDFIRKVRQAGYAALLAYVPPSKEAQKAFARLRKNISNAVQVPILFGFGPRYLHSIGQLYKGGPRQGVFLEFVGTASKDLQIPNTKYTFDRLKKAQAFGDLKALESRKRPAWALDLGKDLKSLGSFQKKLDALLKKSSK